MKNGLQKFIVASSFMGVLSGVFYLSFFIIVVFFPYSQNSAIPVVRMIIGIGAFSCALFWLTGTMMCHRDQLTTLGLIGFGLSVIYLLVVGYWYYISDFVNMRQHFALWNSSAMFAGSCGFLLFGNQCLMIGKFPRPAILLWMAGFIVGSSGMGGLWMGRYVLVGTGLIWCGIYYLLNHEKIDTPRETVKGNPVLEGKSRFASLDLHRGIIIVLMAIDHASGLIRHSHPFEFWNLPLPNYYMNTFGFITRFITHFCAPGFFFIMGIGMIFFMNSRMQKGWTNGEIMRSLAIRGALIILLEKLLWSPIVFSSISWKSAGVLFALGGSMMVCVLFLRFNTRVLFLMGITGILLTQVLPQFIVNLGFYNNPFAILLLVPQILRPWNITYPIFPWMSITLLGMGFGKCLLADKDKALTGLLAAGLICLAVSPIVRWAGGFGNFRNPVMFGFNLVEFLNVVKYPPSLVFTLMTLGGNFILLYLIEKYQHLIGEVRKPLLVFGQTALYFYFIHWFFFCRVNNN